MADSSIPFHELNKRQKTWRVLEKLVVPLTIALVGSFFTICQAELSRQSDQNMMVFQENEADDRSEFEMNQANWRTQVNAMQAYIQQMNVLQEQNELASNEIRDVMQANTLLILDVLETSDVLRGYIIRYLFELDLISGSIPEIEFNGSYCLPGIILESDKLVSINLSNASLDKACIKYCDLKNSRIVNASLNGAELSHSLFINADLTNTRLRNAELLNTNFRGANLTGVDLTNADVGGADFTGAIITKEQLSKARNMNKAIHDL